MTLNLNDEQDFTLERVREFIASVDDSQHRQIRVTLGGIAFMSDTVGGVATEGLAFYLETYCSGNDYVGKAAAKDSEWVSRVYEALKRYWPKVKTGHLVDVY